MPDAAATGSPAGVLAPRLLFVPVSGAYGMGEYARSLAIAQAAERRWPKAEIRFLISAQAPYAAAVPYPCVQLPSSPTFHSRQVQQEIDSMRPDVVIFDNAGRTAQLRAASRAGANVVYISARPRQRRKAFRMRWMRLIDEHWIAYPEFIAGRLNALERLKLHWLRRPSVRYLDVVLARVAQPANPRASANPGEPGAPGFASGPAPAPAAPLGVPGDFVLLVPGGGTGHPGAADAVQRFLVAAQSLAAGGIATLLVGPAALKSAAGGELRCLAPLPQAQLLDLMRAARVIVANGGSTLLQAIACGAACVGVPIARDQALRVERCARAGVAVAAALDAADMAACARRLLQDEAERAALSRRAAALNLADGADLAVRALHGLIERRERMERRRL